MLNNGSTNLNNNALNIFIWNAQSINNKANETFSYMKHLNVHVAIISETWLKGDVSLFDPEFKVYNLNRKSSGYGGVAIIIKRNIQHSLLPTLNLQTIEALAIEVNTIRGKIKLIAAYFKGGTSNIILNKFKSDIQYLTSFQTNFILGGDLNAKHPHWNCYRNNRAGTILYNEMLNSTFVIKFPSSPTHFNHNSRYGSTLDIALTNCPQFIHNMKSRPDLSSDHLPVHFQFDCNPQHYEGLHRYNYSKANWQLYKSCINNKLKLTSEAPIRNIKSCSDIDELVGNLNNIILSAKDKCVPCNKTIAKLSEFKIPEATKMLIRLRNTRRRQWQRTRDPMLKSIVNELHQRIKAEFQILRNNKWVNMIEKLQNDRNTNKLWAVSKNLRQRSKQIPPLYDKENRILITSLEKCESFAAQFAAIQNNDNHNQSSFSQHISSEVNSFLSTHTGLLSSHEFNMTTPKEIKQIIRTIKPRKSPGYDTINGILIKNLPIKGHIFISYLFNACMKFSYFSKHWKMAKVIPILKPGKDKSELSSYRPISLLNLLGKIFEIVLKIRCNKFIKIKNILPDEQFGFRDEISAQHQALRIYQHVRSSFNEKQSTGLILFDIEKAFDRVWHKGLIYKLIQFKFPIYLIKIIYNYLNERRFFVYMSNEKSIVHHINAGVPQGAVLSPILYNLYMADIGNFFSNIHFAQYADDTAIYTSSADPNIIISNLQSNMNTLSSYCAQWDIKLNPSKTQAIFFTRRRATRFLPGGLHVIVDNTPIQWCKKVKYLGLWFDQKMLLQNHIEHTIEKSQKLTKILYPLLCRNSKLSENNKLLIYKMIIRATITYGSQIWSNAAHTHKKRLQIVQNRCLKIIRDLPRRYPTITLHTECNLETLSTYIARLNQKFSLSCLFSENTIIRNLIS